MGWGCFRPASTRNQGMSGVNYFSQSATTIFPYVLPQIEMLPNLIAVAGVVFPTTWQFDFGLAHWS